MNLRGMLMVLFGCLFFFMGTNGAIAKATKAQVEAAVDGASLVELVGAAINTKSQLEKVSAAVEEKAKNISAGKTKTYDVKVEGTKFKYLSEAGKPQLDKAGTKTAGQVQVKGTNKTLENKP